MTTKHAKTPAAHVLGGDQVKADAGDWQLFELADKVLIGATAVIKTARVPNNEEWEVLAASVHTSSGATDDFCVGVDVAYKRQDVAGFATSQDWDGYMVVGSKTGVVGPTGRGAFMFSPPLPLGVGDSFVWTAETAAGSGRSFLVYLLARRRPK